MGIDWDFTPVWTFTRQEGWKDDKGLGPWAFSKKENKPSYNEGDHIATYASPVWSMEEGSNVPITPINEPCGYWTKDYVPSPPPVPTLIFQVETQTSAGGDISIIVKKSYNDLSELSSLSMGSAVWTGVYKAPDIKYGDNYWIAATPTFSAAGGNHSDIIIQKVLVDLSVGWNVTIDVPSTYTVRGSTKLALDLGGGLGYVSLGALGTYQGNRQLIYKFSLADGSNSSLYDTGTVANTCIYDIAFYNNKVYLLGQRRGGYGDGKLQLIQLGLGGVAAWAANTGTYACAGAGLYVDASGIYIAYSDQSTTLPYLWWIEKYSLGGTLQWNKSQNYSPQIPYKIVGDADNIYVLGGESNFVCDVRDKDDGTQLLTRSWYTLASAYCAINPVGNRLDIGGKSGGGLVRNDDIRITDLTVIRTSSGARRAVWGMAYDI